MSNWQLSCISEIGQMSAGIPSAVFRVEKVGGLRITGGGSWKCSRDEGSVAE